MSWATYSLGLDYGTNSVRAVVVSCADGRTVGTHVFDYPSGERGVIVDAGDPHLARQNPADHVEGLRVATAGALAEAAADSGFSRDQIIGIGVDTTGSTPIPIDARCRPLAFDSKWRANPAAHAWLWKDHTAAAEAATITEVARKHAPEYLAPIGGTYSSEWFWSKVWHCLNVAPDVFEAAATWVELADFIPAVLGGVSDPAHHFPVRVRRGPQGDVLERVGRPPLGRTSSPASTPAWPSCGAASTTRRIPRTCPPGGCRRSGRTSSVSGPGFRWPWAGSTRTRGRWERGSRRARW